MHERITELIILIKLQVIYVTDHWSILSTLLSICRPCCLYLQMVQIKCELIKVLVYFVKYCNDIVFFSLFKIFQYKIISISYLSFCFVEINIRKSDRMSIPIQSDHTRTVRPYEYTGRILLWSVTYILNRRHWQPHSCFILGV